MNKKISDMNLLQQIEQTYNFSVPQTISPAL